MSFRVAERNNLSDQRVGSQKWADSGESVSNVLKIAIQADFAPPTHGIERLARAGLPVGNPIWSWRLTTTLDLPTMVQNMYTRIRWRRYDQVYSLFHVPNLRHEKDVLSSTAHKDALAEY